MDDRGPHRQAQRLDRRRALVVLRADVAERLEQLTELATAIDDGRSTMVGWERDDFEAADRQMAVALRALADAHATFLEELAELRGAYPRAAVPDEVLG